MKNNKKKTPKGRREFVVYAEAIGTYFARVYADSAEHALQVIEERDVEWTMSDGTEVGEITGVHDVVNDKTIDVVGGHLVDEDEEH